MCSTTGAHNAMCSVASPWRIVLSASGVCWGDTADLVYDAGGWCRLRPVAIGFVCNWEGNIGSAFCDEFCQCESRALGMLSNRFS